MTEAFRRWEASTTGEFAELVVGAFDEIRQAATATTPRPLDAGASAEIGLIQACFTLLAKIPTQSRHELEGTLPFSPLEFSFLKQSHWTFDSATRREIGRRIDLWIFESPVFVDERSISCADFLQQLCPYLDSWESRRRTIELAKQIHDPQTSSPFDSYHWGGGADPF